MAAAAVLPPPQLLLPAAPSGYHRIVSPTLRIPSEPHVTIPVGILTCQRDPLARELDTVVVDSSFTLPAPQKNGSVKKGHTKQAKASAVPTLSKPYIQLILHDTVLFPEGGGQPYDIGVATAEDGSVWDVDFVKRHGGVAVHYVAAKESLGDVPEIFAAGKKVKLALGDEGSRRRLDHMSMHTAQHLLSAVLENKLNIPTLAWSPTSWPTPSYVDLPRALTPAEVTAIQDEANRLVFEERRVHVEVQELKAGQGGVDTGDSSVRELGRGLPSDYTGGVHRVVVIDGVDRNPCCGTHLPSLASLQMFIFSPPTGGGAGPFRHLFLAGPRLLEHLGNVQALLTRTASAMSCGLAETPDRVQLAVDENKRREKRIEDIERELARTIGRELFDEMTRWRAEGGEGEWTRYVSRVDDTSGALGFLQAIAFAFQDLASKETVPYTVLLTSTPSSQTQTTTTVVMIFASDDARVKKVGEALKASFKTLKGGGKGPRWSGKATGVWVNEREGNAAALALMQG